MVASQLYATYRAVLQSAQEAASERMARVGSELATLASSGIPQRSAAFERVLRLPAVRSAFERNGNVSSDSALAQLYVGSDSSAILLLNARLGITKRVGRPPSVVAMKRLGAVTGNAIELPGTMSSSPIFQDGDRAYYWNAYAIRDGTRVIGMLAQLRRIGNPAANSRAIESLIGDATVLFANAESSTGPWVGLDGTLVEAPTNRAVAIGTGMHRRSGTDYISHAAPVRGTTWIVVSESPAALARQRAFAFLQASWPVAIGIVVLGALLAWTIGHRYTQPMRDLANAANAIGSGDYTRRVEVKHADELGILAAAFNRMGNEIQREIGERQQAEATVRKMNSELEARVRERTTELETANDELQAFSYSVSHDLRSPLRSIDGFSQALLEDYDSQLDDTGKDYLRRLRGGAQRMGHLIDDLLLLSRVTLQPINREDVDLAAMARELIGELHEQDPDRVAHVQIQEGLIALADRGLLWVALQNLIGNAWKFTANAVPAIIEVGARVTDGQTEFFVRDNGAGFDMAYADKLFTPFQRLHSAEEFRGTGIGLATVHRIVARHGGRVWADAAEGRGATFFFTVGGGADGTQHDSAG